MSSSKGGVVIQNASNWKNSEEEEINTCMQCCKEMRDHGVFRILEAGTSLWISDCEIFGSRYHNQARVYFIHITGAFIILVHL